MYSTRSHSAPTLALVVTTLIWGSTFVVAKDVLEQWTPLRYLAVRFAIAACVLFVLFPVARGKLKREEWRAGAVLGALVGGGMLLQAAGQVYTTATKSAFITSLTTPLVPVLGHVLGRARPSRANITGVCVAFLGGLLMLLPGAPDDSAATAGGINVGDALTLGCTIFFATHITFMETYARDFEARRLTALQIASAALLLCFAWACVEVAACVWTPSALPAFVGRETMPLVWSAGVVWGLIYLALVGTVVTFLMWTWGQARVSAVRAAIIFTLEPVFALLFAVAVRGRAELLEGWSAIGALLIVAGVIISEVRFGGRPTP